MTTASIILIVFLSSALAREEKSYLLNALSEVENNNHANPKHVDLRQGKISEFLQSRLQRQITLKDLHLSQNYFSNREFSL